MSDSSYIIINNKKFIQDVIRKNCRHLLGKNHLGGSNCCIITIIYCQKHNRCIENVILQSTKQVFSKFLSHRRPTTIEEIIIKIVIKLQYSYACFEINGN